MNTGTPVYAGIGMAEAAADLNQAITSGSWVEQGLSVAGVGLEAFSLATDPMGYLLQSGAAWLLEHVPPLREALDWAGGRPEQIEQYAKAWRTTSEQVTATAKRFDTDVVKGAASWTGDASEKYRQSAAAQSDLLKAAATSANSVAGAASLVGVLVGVVRTMIRDLVAECCSVLVQIAPKGVAATYDLVKLVTSTIPRWMRRIKDAATKLTRSADRLKPLLGRLTGIWDRIREGLKGLGRGQGDVPGQTTPSGVTMPSHADTPNGQSQAPQPHGGGGGADVPGGGGAGGRPPGGGEPPPPGGKRRQPNAPNPDPRKAHSLGKLDPAKVRRDANGLITHYDGKPVNDHLQDVAKGRAEDIRARWDAGDVSRKQTGEVSSVGVDRETGEMFEAVNGRAGEIIPPDKVHPVLQQRMDEIAAGRPYPQYGENGLQPNANTDWPFNGGHPLQHSEVKVVNEMLWARDPAGKAGADVLGEMRVDNWKPFGQAGPAQIPCCANCNRMIAGVPSQAGRYTNGPYDPANKLIVDP